MKLQNIILLVLLCMFSNTTFSQTLRLKQSSVNWDASAIGNFSNHSGNMNRITGFLNTNNNGFTGKLDISTQSFTVTSATGKEKIKLEKTLKEDGFLEVNKYPNATMEILSSKCINASKNKYEITAKITVKNKSKTTSFPATVISDNNYVKISTEPLNVNRMDFNLRLKPLIKDTMVKDIFKVSFDFIFTNNSTL